MESYNNSKNELFDDYENFFKPRKISFDNEEENFNMLRSCENIPSQSEPITQNIDKLVQEALSYSIPKETIVYKDAIIVSLLESSEIKNKKKSTNENATSEIKINRINVMSFEETNRYHKKLQEVSKLEKFEKELKKFRNNKIPEGFYWNEKNQKFEKLAEIAIIDNEIENMNNDQKLTKSNYIAKNISKEIAQKIKNNPDKSKDILVSQIKKVNPIDALKDYNKEMFKEYLNEIAINTLSTSSKDNENELPAEANVISSLTKSAKVSSSQLNFKNNFNHNNDKNLKGQISNNQIPRISANYFCDYKKPEPNSNNIFKKYSILCRSQKPITNNTLYMNSRGGVTKYIPKQVTNEEIDLNNNHSNSSIIDLGGDSVRTITVADSLINSQLSLNIDNYDEDGTIHRCLDDMIKYFKNKYSMQLDIHKEFRNFIKNQSKVNHNESINSFFWYITSSLNKLNNSDDSSSVYLGKKRRFVEENTEPVYTKDISKRNFKVINLNGSNTEVNSINSLNSSLKINCFNSDFSLN